MASTFSRSVILGDRRVFGRVEVGAVFKFLMKLSWRLKRERFFFCSQLDSDPFCVFAHLVLIELWTIRWQPLTMSEYLVGVEARSLKQIARGQNKALMFVRCRLSVFPTLV